MFNWISSAGRTKELIQRMIIVLISSCTNNDATIQVSYAMNVILRFDKMFFFSSLLDDIFDVQVQCPFESFDHSSD